jgi:hypothetical protein
MVYSTRKKIGNRWYIYLYRKITEDGVPKAKYVKYLGAELNLTEEDIKKAIEEANKEYPRRKRK